MIHTTYECDREHCHCTMNHEPPVTIKGLYGISDLLDMPEDCHAKHFCSVECFWGWSAKNIPDEY